MMLHMLKLKDIPAQIEKPLWVDQLRKRKPQYMNTSPSILSFNSGQFEMAKTSLSGAEITADYEVLETC